MMLTEGFSIAPRVAVKVAVNRTIRRIEHTNPEILQQFLQYLAPKLWVLL